MKRVIHSIPTIMPLIAVFMVVVQFVFTNELASLGSKVHELDESISTLREDQSALSQQVAVAKSLSVVRTKAHQLGFVDTSEYLSLSAPFVALKP